MNPFSNSYLSGKNAFFYAFDYKKQLEKEFNEPTASCSYQSGRSYTKEKISNLFYIFDRITKPFILPSVKSPKAFGTTLASETSPWKYKRVKVLVGELSIDAVIMGRASTLGNKKWVLSSVGRSQRYEDVIAKKEFKSLLRKIDSNAIVFNYPKVGASKGRRNAKSMVAAYQAVLEFLENEERGIGAKQILGYGYSMGGGVQGEALKTYNLADGMKKGINYLFVKDRTFSTLEKAAHSLTNGALGWIIPQLGWSLNSVDSSIKLSELNIPEIIVQTTDEKDHPISDGVISANASLKKELLEFGLAHKWYIDIPNHKADSLHECSMDQFLAPLANKINDLIHVRPRISWIVPPFIKRRFGLS